MAAAAVPNRRAAVVKTPRPANDIFIATALDPKRMHKNTVNMPAANERSWFEGWFSGIEFIFSGNLFMASKERL
jgi:hypothetical protein